MPRISIAEAAGKLSAASVVTVQSHTDPSVTYELTKWGSAWLCNCPGFRYRGGCKHADEQAAKESHDHPGS